MTKFLKQCWIFLAILIITAAIISSLFRALTPWAKQYKSEVEHHLSVILGTPVTINTMETGWYWFEPVIKLNQVKISNGKQEVLKLNKLLVGINLFSSLWHWQIQPGILFIDNLHLNVRQIKGRWQIAGLSGKDNMVLDAHSYQLVLAWVLAQQKIVLKNLSADIYAEDGLLIPVKGLNLVIANRRGNYNVKGRAFLAQKNATQLQLVADFKVNPYATHQASGHLFLSLEHLLPAQWKVFMPEGRFHLSAGEANIQLWADMVTGQWQNVQTKVQLDHFAWTDKQTLKKQAIDFFKANLAWKSINQGWELAGDHIQLHLNQTRWPDNSLLIRYQKDNQSYFVFVKNILLKSLFSTSISWPKAFNTIISLHPEGQLFDTQVKIQKDIGINYVLAQFSNISWQAVNSIPAVNKLTGALHWQPDEGGLKLNGEKMVLAPKEKAPIVFTTLNAAFDWKKINSGFQINMKHLAINHPNLLFNARGALKDFSKTSAGQLHLTGEFSANDAHYWLSYIPEKRLKPKLEAWLKQDIKRIAKLNGDLVVNGSLTDFPFDKQPGEFLIRSHLEGVDLIFARNWPLTTAIEGYLQVNKRTLEATINHANLKGIIANNGNLRVSDIGLDREVLTIHSKIESHSAKALSYILASPLAKKLGALAMLKMRGPLALDLQIEAPLYPQNDKVLALGNILFKNNNIDVRYNLSRIQFNELNGSLDFNQEGVIQSNLKTNILNSPVDVNIQSFSTPKPHTEVKMKGQTNVEVLSKQLNLPLSKLMHGSFWLESVLTLSNNPEDSTHLQINSKLDGLGIDLPQPLAKSTKDEVPLTLDLKLVPKKPMQVHLNYGNRLSSDLALSNTKKGLVFQKGEIRLGGGKVQIKNKKGLALVGELNYFDLQEWLATRAKFTGIMGSSPSMDVINQVNVQLQEAKFWKEKYKKLNFQAVKTGGEWFIRLRQPSVIGTLHYNVSHNSLSGKFEKLRIKQTTSLEKANPLGNFNLKPMDLPNLDLQVNSFKFGNLDLGEVNLKSRSLANVWKLDYCKVNTPFYQLTAKGEWQQEGKVNATKIQADLFITDLARSLERWKISPVVEAQHGSIQFRGGWPASLFNFSLAKVNGEMSISFKEGRITNLSPETEGKLGLGKLLSILSLQTIPRRLKLDFSDLSNDGYSFDEFRGNFDIVNGVMTTQDSYINGPVAYATMRGNLDIAKQLYDLDLRVSPHITASLPIVATIAGGPIAGFATWIAGKLINQGMQKISGYTYKVSGSWQQPVVQQVKIFRHEA